MENFISLNSPDSNARSNCVALKDELSGKLVFDDPRVFKRLALDCVSPQFVDNCAQGLQTDQKLLDARQELQNITAAAIRKQIEVQEAHDELESWEFFGTRIVKKVEEKKMYKPLVCL
jgi:hypothetical protein